MQFKTDVMVIKCGFTALINAEMGKKFFGFDLGRTLCVDLGRSLS